MPVIMGMPKIGVNMTEATISKWLISEGDHIAPGQPVLEAETDKLTQEIPSTMSGRVTKFLAFEGDTVEILQPVALVEQDGELTEKAKDEPKITRGARTRISPLAKKTAKQLGLDYTLVKPAREGERICKEDVLRYAGQIQISAPAPAPEKPANEPAARPAPGVNLGAAATLALRADMTEFVNLRGKLEAGGKNAGFADMLALYISHVRKDFPELDLRVDNGGAPHISNPGMFEIEYFAPAVTAPGQCALGVGAVVKIPAVIKDAVEIRSVMTLALCFDTSVDETAAARFLQKLKHALENPVLIFCF
ncbi:MAG: 2-oxo acid dehydrogenase subunit E2 [Oscillospiraceae bacterium]|nr:2-oxo acid dehydrogenase subunit E2 [Oscillospiraceae bacterium]